MEGILYGIGTGPGDPELMTLKAVKTANSSDVIVLPISDQSIIDEPVYFERLTEEAKKLNAGCIAFQIAEPNLENLDNKGFLYLPMPMHKDKEVLKRMHDAGVGAVLQLLKEGKKLAFLTLGDPTIYSTYLYIHNRVLKNNGKAEIISGIPSFCATAARLNMGLVENKDQLHVVPASYGVEEALALSGTKVFMKAGRKMAAVKKEVKDSGQNIWMVENCGMKNEKVYVDVDDIPDQSSYYSLLIVKEEN